MSRNKQQKTTVSRQLKQLKEVPGLLTCLMDHSIVKSEIQFKWTGPKIPAQEWQQILAFFQWTYDTTQSESQVRLYVNATLKTWKAWAFPQEAKTGMSAHEIDSPEAATQREQFNPTEGWIYFGTVHHHCSMGAFQSNVDQANEQNQDGLHITIGKMAADRYDMHERFYINGHKIEIDLDWFWDIGDQLTTLPDWARAVMPGDIEDRIARGQMICKVDKDQTFPEIWKTNLIYQKPVVTQHQGVITGGSYYGGYNGHRQGIFQRSHTNTKFDLEIAFSQLKELCEEEKIPLADGVTLMWDLFDQHPFHTRLINLMYRNDVSLDKFLIYVDEEIEKEEQRELNKELKEAMVGEGGKPDPKDDSKGNGVPSYDSGNPYQHWSDNGV